MAHRANAARETGGGTVLIAGLACCLLLLLTSVVGLGQAVTAAAQAATAADLAALAGADALRGVTSGEPCAVAAAVAARHDAQLASCQLIGQDMVQVEVIRASRLPWPATGRARAGPPTERPPRA